MNAGWAACLAKSLLSFALHYFVVQPEISGGQLDPREPADAGREAQAPQTPETVRRPGEPPREVGPVRTEKTA